MSERYRVRRLGTTLVVASFGAAEKFKPGECIDKLAAAIKVNRLPSTHGYELQWANLRLHRWETVAKAEKAS